MGKHGVPMTYETFLFLLTILICGGVGYTSYWIGFKQSASVHNIVMLTVFEEFLKEKMGEEWTFITLGKDGNRLHSFMLKELAGTIEEE